VRVPLVDMPSPDPLHDLLNRRTVLVSGRLDDEAVTHLCAQLMALDGRSGADVELIINSGGGPLSSIRAALDVLDLMRAKLNATCVGMAGGTAAVLLCCATGERRAGRNARIDLSIEDLADETGTADELARRAAEHAAELRRTADLLASRTGTPAASIATELESGAPLDADAARSLGIVDAVVGRA
jgi:ATP-dependent Clp protease, protease subunit